MRKYAGIGSRETPKGVLEFMQDISSVLSHKGWLLRSGGANGADYAFASNSMKKELFIPWNGYNGYSNSDPGVFIPDQTPHKEEAYRIASHFHPAWNRCSDGAKKLHTRNVYILGGFSINDPVDMVICWTPNGETKGGTGQGIRMAEYLNIPIYNLANENQSNALMEVIGYDL